MGCETTRIFHGRISYNMLDHKLGLNTNPKVLPTTDFADEFQRRTPILVDTTKKNFMQSYLKWKKNITTERPKRRFFDKRAFILQPIADYQGSKILF